MHLTVVHTRVFAAEPRGGSPAPVVLDPGSLGVDEMRGLATRFGVETVFVIGSTDDRGTGYRLRFFAPRREMEMCVHGTVAALCALQLRGRLSASEIAFETGIGRVHASWEAQSGGVWAAVAQRRPVFSAGGVSAAEVAAVLGVEPDAVDSTVGPIESVSTSRAKLIVPLVSADALDASSPELESLWQLCDRRRVTGVYPFTVRPRDRSSHAEARQFPLRAGYGEDPATGVAASALAAYLLRHRVLGRAARGWHEFSIAQGRALGRASVMSARGLVERGEVVATEVRGTAIVEREERVQPR